MRSHCAALLSFLVSKFLLTWMIALKEMIDSALKFLYQHSLHSQAPCCCFDQQAHSPQLQWHYSDWLHRHWIGIQRSYFVCRLYFPTKKNNQQRYYCLLWYYYSRWKIPKMYYPQPYFE